MTERVEAITLPQGHRSEREETRRGEAGAEDRQIVHHVNSDDRRGDGRAILLEHFHAIVVALVDVIGDDVVVREHESIGAHEERSADGALGARRRLDDLDFEDAVAVASEDRRGGIAGAFAGRLLRTDRERDHQAKECDNESGHAGHRVDRNEGRARPAARDERES